MSGQTIATCGGYEMVEVGPRIYFIDRETHGYAIAMFVVGLLTLMVGVNGFFQLMLGRVAAGVILGAAAAGLVVVFGVVLRARRARLALRWDAMPPLAYLDRATGTVHDASGRTLAHLAQVAFAPAFQMTSSSQALEMRYPGGSIVIARGSPFSGSVGTFIDALRARGQRA